MSNIQSAYQPNRFKAQPAQIQAAPPPHVPPPAPAPPSGGNLGNSGSQISHANFYQPQGFHNPALVDPGQFSNMIQYRSGATEFLFDSDYDDDDDNIYAGVSNSVKEIPIAPSQERALLQPLTQNQVHADQCNLSSVAVFDKTRYPWIVSIQNKSTRQHIKTGVLIYSNLVLSAHDNVLTDVNNISVNIGGVNLDNPGEFVTRSCSGIVKHPEYNVILLKLSEPVFNIKPVTVNTGPSIYLNGIEVGWGSLSGKPGTKTLFEMNIPLLRPEVCKNAFNSKFNENVNVCGGFPNCSTILPCLGDTGDPLIVNVGNEMVLEGISQYHINCELKLGLASWVKVSAINNWIRQNVSSSPPPLPPTTFILPPGTTVLGTSPSSLDTTTLAPNTIVLSTAPPPPTRTASRFATTARATVPLTSTTNPHTATQPLGTPPCGVDSGNSGIVILVIVFLLILALYALTKL